MELKIKVPREQLLQLKSEVVDKIKSLKNYGSLKFDIKLILDVCNIIENAKIVKKSKTKIDKKALVLEIFESAFEGLDPDSKNNIGDIIEHLHADKKIRVEPILKWLGKIVVNALVNKVL